MIELNTPEQIQEKTQSVRQSLTDTRQETNFDLLNSTHGRSSVLPTFFLSLEKDNSIVFNTLKKQEGKSLILEFPPFLDMINSSIEASTLKRQQVKRDQPKIPKKGTEPKKGLRQMSRFIKQLLCSRKDLTYTQVAEQVISKSQEGSGYFEGEKISSINVKRRVYDVLAVLSSLEFLHRDNKKRIYPTSKCFSVGIGNCKNSQEYINLTQALSKARKSVQQKTQILKNSLLYYQKMKQLIQRNLKILQHQEIKQKSIDRYFGTYVEKNKVNKIYFPFFVLEVPEVNEIEIETNNKSNKVVLRGVSSGLTGDVSFVQKLNLPPCRLSRQEIDAQKLLDGMKAFK